MPRRAWVWVAQGAVTVLVLVFVVRALLANWEQLRSLEFDVVWHPASIAAAVLVTLATYALQVGSWGRVLTGWGQRTRYGTAARIWCLANLARYVPGRVWGVAGLVMLAQRAGIASWAAAASTVAVQALGIGTAFVVGALAAPSRSTPLALLAAALAAFGTLGLLAWPRVVERVSRLFPAAAPWRPLDVPHALQAGALTLLAWITYGTAFWLLAQGVGVAGLRPVTAAGVFAIGYIVGLVAIFAPGGIVVREAALVALLTPIVGSGGAVALSIASRIQLTLTEVAAAAVALAVERRTRGGPA